MASRATLLLIMIAATIVVAATAAVVPAETEQQSYHRVGDESGWVNTVDYDDWASGKTFRVGDILEFVYSPAYHNVNVVDEQSYADCTVPPNAITFNSGGDKITLTQAGQRYFICGIPDSCKADNMKLSINVQEQ